MAVDKPIIVVVHGTSKQGTSVVISLLQTNKFVVKAITRDASSDNAKQLAAKGAEMVEADASDAAQLRAAFEGAYGVFAVTVAMAYGGTEGLYERELATGKMMADAAAAAGVKVFVFSTLEDVDKRTQGKWFVPHFTSKMHVVKYVEEKHPGMIGIYPAVGAFYTNFIEYMPPRKGDDGVLTFALPVGGDVPCQWLNPYTATGPVVAAAFTEPEKYRGTVIPVYDEVLTPKQMVDTFTHKYHTLSKEEMVGAGAPESVADMQLHMYSYIAEFGYYAPDRNMELVHKINPHPETWAEFLKTTGFDGSQKLAAIRCKLL